MFYVSQEGLLVGIHPKLPIVKVLWDQIESVELNPNNPNDLLLHLNQNNFIGKLVKTRHILFPLNKPELFKNEVIKFAPENNSLRVWVEAAVSLQAPCQNP